MMHGQESATRQPAQERAELTGHIGWGKLITVARELADSQGLRLNIEAHRAADGQWAAGALVTPRKRGEQS